MSGIATATRSTRQFLEKAGKKLVPGTTISPIFEVIDRIAQATGGCVNSKHGLEDTIYVTQNHVKYAGGLDKTLNRLEAEIGDIRKKFRFDVEVNTLDQFKEAQKFDCDVIHVIGLSDGEIRELFEHTDITKMPILHLNAISDFKPEFHDYFFRNCAIESLTGDAHPIKNRLIVS
jgi:nicotinate-nucleotide pyrophosphorylase